MRLVVTRPWMHSILILAGLYNLTWGFFAILEPSYFFENLNLQLPNYLMMWQGIGLIEILFGLGYLIASRKPYKHWVIIFLGFVTKLAATTGFFYFLATNKLPFNLLYLVLANDAIWLLPFFLILFHAFDFMQSNRELEAYDLHPRKLKSLESIITSDGKSLQHYSDQWPTMLIFLRHFGCTFCRESLKEIEAKREYIENEGTKIILVHMVDEAMAKEITQQYHLSDLPRISDPDKKIYKAFGLLKGNWFQLFGINVVIRGFIAGFLKRNLPGPPIGDSYQMPGIFVIHKGMVMQTFKHTTAADRPDYIELAHVRTEE